MFIDLIEFNHKTLFKLHFFYLLMKEEDKMEENEIMKEQENSEDEIKKEVKEVREKKSYEEADEARDAENLKKVEAALFVAGKFLSVQELVALTDLNPILLNRTLSELAERYDDAYSIEVVNKGDLWKMDVKQGYHDMANKLAGGSNEFTKAEQETLAIIAYKHPITQAKIISVRGNKAYEHVKRFVELGLVKSKKSGRTRELALSDEFYDYFNVKERSLKKENGDKEIKEDISKDNENTTPTDNAIIRA